MLGGKRWRGFFMRTRMVIEWFWNIGKRQGESIKNDQK
jgi:hypothetical protein